MHACFIGAVSILSFRIFTFSLYCTVVAVTGGEHRSQYARHRCWYAESDPCRCSRRSMETVRALLRERNPYDHAIAADSRRAEGDEATRSVERNPREWWRSAIEASL